MTFLSNLAPRLPREIPGFYYGQSANWPCSPAALITTTLTDISHQMRTRSVTSRSSHTRLRQQTQHGPLPTSRSGRPTRPKPSRSASGRKSSRDASSGPVSSPIPSPAGGYCVSSGPSILRCLSRAGPLACATRERCPSCPARSRTRMRPAYLVSSSREATRRPGWAWPTRVCFSPRVPGSRHH